MWDKLLCLISKLLKKAASILFFISDKIYNQKELSNSLQAKRVEPWFKSNGHKTFRLNYELTNKSIVFDLGGYEGQWAADIFCKYGCQIHIFEPLPEYARKIIDRFKSNPAICVYNFGLSISDTSEKLWIADDSSSIFKLGKESAEITLRRIDDFLREQKIKSIDLIKINIEGAEYDLLEYVIEKKIVNDFKNIQIQFHDFVPNAESRMKVIKAELEKTHFLTYEYEFVWENWKIKK